MMKKHVEYGVKALQYAAGAYDYNSFINSAVETLARTDLNLMEPGIQRV